MTYYAVYQKKKNKQEDLFLCFKGRIDDKQTELIRKAWERLRKEKKNTKEWYITCIGKI